MQRIDGPTRSATLPVPRAVGIGGNAPGYFQDGNPLNNTPPTTLDRDWANMVQEELVAPIIAAGLTLDKADHGQLLAALHILFVAAGGTSGVVIGTNEVSMPLPGGFVLKFGTVLASVIEQSVSHGFDAAFPNQCWVVIPVIINASGSSQRDVWAQVQALSPSGFTLYLEWSGSGQSSGPSDGYQYIAIGN
jgi:hypothetical protein